MRRLFRGHHSSRRSSAARRLATAAEETTPSAVGCSATHKPPLRALPRRPSPQVASPDPISRSGEYRPPPGRPCSLVRGRRQPTTSAAIPRPAATRPPPASWGNTRWASRAWRRVVLALRPPPRLRDGCLPRPLGSTASATICCARLSNAEQLGKPDMACRGRWIFAAGSPSTERIFELRSRRWRRRVTAGVREMSQLVGVGQRPSAVGDWKASRWAAAPATPQICGPRTAVRRIFDA